MITQEKFIELKNEVEQAVYELINHMEKRTQNNDIIVFISKSEYLIDNEGTPHSVWSVEYELERIQESDTTKFLLRYLNSKYRNIKSSTEDNKNDLILELMLYTHIWESTRHIKLLRRIALLASGDNYEPYVYIPDNLPRYTFIKEQIRDIFENERLKIYDIVKKCYKSQFRNAFAHNDFSLSSNSIIFNNYSPPNHPYKTLKIDDWTEIFILSALLKTTLNNKIDNFSKKFQDGKSYDVTFRHNQRTDQAIIKYDSDRNEFVGTLK